MYKSLHYINKKNNNLSINVNFEKLNELVILS